jgi:protein arginine kinase activator
MKCQRCIKPATLHITEVLGEANYEEVHLCEECAQKYLYEQSQPKKPIAKFPEEAVAEENDETGFLNERHCEVCGMKFVDFRNSGRLGCPHDYQAFVNELTPLLESIHGNSRHCGKTPRRLPQNKQVQQELTRLKKQLHQAVVEEAYEEAAKIRDRIKELEGVGE